MCGLFHLFNFGKWVILPISYCRCYWYKHTNGIVSFFSILFPFFSFVLLNSLLESKRFWCRFICLCLLSVLIHALVVFMGSYSLAFSVPFQSSICLLRSRTLWVCGRRIVKSKNTHTNMSIDSICTKMHHISYKFHSVGKKNILFCMHLCVWI